MVWGPQRKEHQPGQLLEILEAPKRTLNTHTHTLTLQRSGLVCIRVYLAGLHVRACVFMCVCVCVQVRECAILHVCMCLCVVCGWCM